MIDLYYWGTPNGRKITIMLEECQLPYRVYPINISKDEQFQPHFLSISPNNKIPAIIDTDSGESVFESGAILIYLAEKTGQFLPDSGTKRVRCLEWLMWQMGGFGPMLGQTHHFMKFAKEDVPYGKKRYGDETQRLYGVLDRRLADNAYLAGNVYTIADMATLPWAARHEWHGVELDKFSHVKRWYDAMMARPAVAKAMELTFD